MLRKPSLDCQRRCDPLVGSNDVGKRRVEEVTGLPFVFELAVA